MMFGHHRRHHLDWERAIETLTPADCPGPILMGTSIRDDSPREDFEHHDITCPQNL
jgi:hypothetical protein